MERNLITALILGMVVLIIYIEFRALDLPCTAPGLPKEKWKTALESLVETKKTEPQASPSLVQEARETGQFFAGRVEYGHYDESFGNPRDVKFFRPYQTQYYGNRLAEVDTIEQQ